MPKKWDAINSGYHQRGALQKPPISQAEKEEKE